MADMCDLSDISPSSSGCTTLSAEILATKQSLRQTVRQELSWVPPFSEADIELCNHYTTMSRVGTDTSMWHFRYLPRKARPAV